MIEFEHVTRAYGDKPAVTDLSLQIAGGEMFALLGPNGAGKTTTIKMLVGLLQPSSGSVRICGIDVATRPREACRLLGLVPDEPYLYDKLSGREFLEFVTDMHGLRADSPRSAFGGRFAISNSRRSSRIGAKPIRTACGNGSRLPRRWYRIRPCWSWTSQWSGWTPAACGC